MKTPMQQIIEQIEAVKRDDPKTAIYNLNQIARELLDEEREMVKDAWVAGNKEGWDMNTDWPDDGYLYYDEKYKSKH